MPLLYDDEVRVFRITCGSNETNAYVVVDPETAEGVIIDAPEEPEKILEKAQGIHITAILITHTHAEQMKGLPLVRSRTDAPLWVHANDAVVFNYFTPVNSERPEHPFYDGATIPVGRLVVRAIHTPDHTPGATCYLVGRHLFTGDAQTPGPTSQPTSPESLRQSVQSVAQKLFTLPDDTIVHPGHGDDSTLARIKAEYQASASQPL